MSHEHDDCLHCAFEAAEKALPEDGLLSLEQREHPLEGGTYWSAVVFGVDPQPEANERTPASALRALAERLATREPSGE